jgi:2-polyprenyl-6-methoxyphenol hydroxylase-like FAD-dependent oxidoreductase
MWGRPCPALPSRPCRAQSRRAMRGSLDVGVIGAGTAGAAVALALVRAGHRVTVYERVRQPEANGAGILLQPTGQCALRRLGLLDAVLARCAPIAQLRCETLGRREVFRLRYDDIPGGHKGYGLHRGVLFRALFDALGPAGVTLRTGVEVEDLAEAREGWVHFVTPSRERLGPHQLCIVADGARSQLRDDTDLEKSVTPHTWGATWCVLEDPENVFAGELRQVVQGTRRMVGSLPSGVGPEGDTPRVSVFGSLRATEVDAWRARGLDAWKADVREAMPALDPLLAQVRSLDEVLFTRYHDVSMPAWHCGHVVYLGDAAHAMSPQLGQGANLALWDAMVLAECVAAEASVDLALARYSDARRAHLRFYQAANRWATLWFQSDHDALGALRDAFMPLAMKVPPLYRAMVTTLAGINTGVGLGATEPLR